SGGLGGADELLRRRRREPDEVVLVAELDPHDVTVVELADRQPGVALGERGQPEAGGCRSVHLERQYPAGSARARCRVRWCALRVRPISAMRQVERVAGRAAASGWTPCWVVPTSRVIVRSVSSAAIV